MNDRMKIRYRTADDLKALAAQLKSEIENYEEYFTGPETHNIYALINTLNKMAKQLDK